MVAIVTGNGLGIARSSAAQLGGQGQIGVAAVGRGNDRVYVDAANGNLVVQRSDEVLTGVGPDASYGLTYNSEDGASFGGAPASWTLSTSRRILSAGPLNSAGGTATRVGSDGSTTLFTFDTAKGYYTSDDGAGATNELRFSAGAWILTDGGSRATERYETVAGTYLIKVVADADGNAQTYDYNADGTVSTITESNGDYMSMVWTGGRLSQVTTSYRNGANLLAETRIHYSYDALNRLQTAIVDLTPGDGSVADNAVYATTYGYDGNSLRIASITQTDGSRIDIGYTQAGAGYYVTSITETVANGVARVTGLYYDLGQRTTTITDPLGGVTTMRYDSAGNLVGLVRPVPAPGAAAPTTSFEYNAKGDVAAVVENGRRTDYDYDAAGNLRGMRDADGNTVTRTYGPQNQLMTETHWLAPQASINGGSGAYATTRFAYDSEFHLRFTVTAEGDVTEYRYNPAGQLTSTLAYAGSKYDVSTWASDAWISESGLQSWTLGIDRSNAERTDTSYDARGNVHDVTRYQSLDSSGEPVVSAGYSRDTYVYDQAGLLLSRINSADARGEVFAYDGLGRIISATDTANATTTTYYDDANSRTVVTSLATGLTRVSVYDKAGELLSTTESGPGVATALTKDDWDALGRLRVETDATDRKTYHVYDAASRKVADVTADGGMTEYGYDSSDRLVRKIEYLNRLSTSQIALLSGFSAGGAGGFGKGGVSGPIGSSLLTNGSFDAIDPSATAGANGYTGTVLQGWSKNDPTFVQQIGSGQLGVPASDGGYWLDLDSLAQSGLVTTGANHVLNGSFESSASGAVDSGTMITGTTMPNWTATNPQPFQQVASGQGGVGASDGVYWLDLDSTFQTGTVTVGGNLLQNGSFETSGTGATASSTGFSGATLPYWTSLGGQLFQQFGSGQGGIAASNGSYWLDLDSVTQTGWAGSGTNLLTNGSFETFDLVAGTLSGWAKDNPEPFQPTASGTGGVTASGGSYWLDLDSTRQTGLAATGSNLLANGSFDTVAQGATATASGYSSSTLSGWTATNTQPFQQVASGQFGVTGSDGAYWLDLDSASQTGWAPGATNILTNGSFDASGSGSTIPGWTKTNPQPFDVLASGTGGVTASNGPNWLDLDSTMQTGVVPTGTNIVTNGSFETFDLAAGTMTGWVKDNPEPFQPMASGQRGVTASNGSYWLDLDSTAQTGLAATGSNLLTNGSFDAVAQGATATATGYSSSTLSGWTATNAQPFQQVASGQLGVTGSNGAYWLDLDSTSQTGWAPGTTNLLTNGSFDASGSGSTIPGWTKTNSQPFDVLASGSGGVAASDGANWLDLDSTVQTGVAPTGANLLTNGSFETSSANYTTTATGRYNSSLPGWSNANAAGFDQMASGQRGVSATDGSYWLDLDGTVQTRVATGANLLVNGSFEQATNPSSVIGGRSSSSIAGWTNATSAPFTEIASGQKGVTATDGSYWLDLWSSGGLVEGTNYVANGSFEQVTGTPTTNTNGQLYSSIPSWTKTSTSRGFEIVNSGTFGTTATDGSVFLDMGQLDMSQTVTLPTTTTTTISFDYSNTAGTINGAEGPEPGAVLTVWWNGFQIATLGNATTTPVRMAYQVSGRAGANTLRFTSSSNAGHGATIDNVKVYQTSQQTSGGTMDIKQTVGGLAAGQVMSLQFDHALSPIQVLWNGQVVDTVPAGINDDITTSSYFVTATAGNNVLEFKGATTDAALDNVRLFATQLNATPANMDISQTVGGLAAGQTMWLQFDTANAAPTGSGSFDVLWNGQVIDTITSTGTGMQAKTYQVTAVAGNNIIRFRGTGTADDVGASIDNVRLFATQPVYTPGNMDIKQTVTGLAAGQMMSLQFDFANRTTSASGSFDVLWNGQVIDSISATGTAMQTKSYFVTAVAGSNTVEFRGTGTADDVGASLDNVRLTAAQPVYTPGNMDIKQAVTGLAAGQIMQLQFDYANRTSSASGSFDVLWNGQVIDSISATGTAMQTKSYFVTAAGGTDQLEFRGTGTADDVGASLDNVRLFATQPVFTPGNMDIHQTIPGLSAGQVMQLQFDTANAAPAGSGSFEVWWNGQLLETITSTGTTMQTKTYVVTAVAGNNIIRFRGTGTADDVGASIDNVRLFATQPVYTPGNMDIKQTVTGLAAGQMMSLQFDFANRTTSASGSFDVLWNGQVIDSISATGTAMQTKSYFVTAVAGSNTVEFRGTGTADDVGASLDNVRLTAAQPVYTPGNMDIKQAVTGLAAGQIMQLQFDYANRTSSASGSFDVLWNGQVIDSISATGTAMQTKSYFVTAAGGTDQLEFRGTGTADDVGASLDNVRLFATQPVFTPGNMDIHQTVSGLTAGQMMQLQFNYANRTTAQSGSFEVWWNGQLLDTISDTGTTMRPKVYFVAAVAGDNTVRFRGTGTADDVGASIDNVRLLVAQPVYTPGNMDISQSVDGLAAGQLMQLQFDYASRAAAGSGSFEVWWNNQLLETVTDATATMRSKVYTVTAVAGTNAVRFHGTGTADDVGASLDNVALSATQPVYAPGNMDIRQTIAGLTAGKLMQLQFDHANRTASSSGSFDVLWNGQVVATINDSGTAMKTETFTVTAAGGGNDVLRFRGTGTADDVGASLDNVRLFDTAPGLVPGNVDISQTIAALSAGEIVELQFDHANRTTAGSGSFQVLWNDQVVATITDSGAAMKTETLLLTAGAAGNKLAFRGTGTADDVGASLDNVRLFRVGANAPVAAAASDPLLSLRPTASADGDLWTWNVYDAADRLVETLDSVGRATSFAYDSDARLVGSTAYSNLLDSATIGALKAATPTAPVLPAASAGADRTLRSFYDTDGQLVGTLDGTGAMTQIHYDAAGRKIREEAYANTAASSLWSAGSFAALIGSIAPASADRRTDYVYDDRGLLRFTIDAAARPTEFVYDGSGRIIRTVDYSTSIAALAGGAAYTFAYVQAHLVSSSGDRVTRSVFDDSGRIAYAIDAEGGTLAYRYDAGGNVDRVTAFATVYSAAGDPSASDMQTWVSAPGIASSDDRVTRTFRDAAGQVAFTVDGEQYVTAYRYDAAGRLTSETRYDDALVGMLDGDTAATLASRIPAGAAGLTKTYGYDGAGRQTDVTVDAVTTHFDYDGHGQVTDLWEAYGTTDQTHTHRHYDAAGRLRCEVRAPGTGIAQTVSYEYDGLGNLVRQTDEHGSVTVRTYDLDGRVTTVTAPLTDTASAVTHYAYDALGNLVRSEDPRSNATYYYYDRLGRLTLQVDPLNFGTSTSYTAFGQVESVTRYANAGGGVAAIGTPPVFTATNPNDPSVTRQDATTRFAYDKAGRVKQVTDAENASESYTLNAFGERRVVTNKLAGVTTNVFDRRGLLTGATETVRAPDGSTVGVVTTFDYYASGNRRTMTEAAGEVEQRKTTYTYDRMDRLTKVEHDQISVTDPVTLATQDLTPTETTEYDRRGNVVRTVDAGGGTAVFYYDALDRRIAAVDPAGTLTTWTYSDSARTVTTNSYALPAGTVADPYGAPPVGSGTPRTTRLDYDRGGRLVATTVYNAAVGTDSNGVYSASASTNLATQTYYDAAGNVVRAVDPRGNSVWSWYDAAGRKIAQVDQENFLTSWTLDAEGNVLREIRYAAPVTGGFDQNSSLSTITPAPNADDRITDFDYDRNGRRVREKRLNVETYSVSDQGVLSGPSIATSIIEYSYNALGEVHTKKEATGDVTTYDYDSAGRLVLVRGPAYTDFSGASVQHSVANRYDGLGDLVSSTVNGVRATNYEYKAGGRLAKMTDAAQFERTYGYDRAGRVVKEQWTRTLSDGVTKVTEANVTRYDSAGRVVTQGMATRAPDGSWSFGDLAQFRYNGFGDLDAKGMHDLWQERFDYDGAGRLWRSTSGDGTTKYFLSDGAGNRTLSVSSTGASTTSAINTVGDLVSYLSNNSSNAIGSAPVAGLLETIAEFDGRGLATTTREPFRELGQGQSATIVSRRTYNAFGEAASETDARGLVPGADPESFTTHFIYNTMGRLVRKVDPAVAVTDEHGVTTAGAHPTHRSFYDTSGRLVGTQDANGNIERVTLLAGSGYDGGTASILKDFHADGGVVETRYDAFGDAREIYNELSTAGSTAYRETRAYDAMDRLVSVTHRGGLLTDTYVYDELGQRTGHWNSFYGSGVVERTDYDSQGRVTSQSDLSGLTTSYSYAWQQGAQTAGLGTFGGWLKTTTAPGAPYQATETQDYFGRTVARTDLGGHTYGFTYDSAGQLVTRTNSAGEYLSFSYYNGGQVAGQSGTQGDAAYAYDIAGNLVAETFSLNGIARRNATASYDALNRMTAWQDQGYLNAAPASSAWTYDANGNIRSVSATHVSLDNAGNVTGSSSQASWYAYDKMNRVTVSEGILDPDSGTVSRGTTGRLISYDLAGERKSVLYTASVLGSRWEYLSGEPGTRMNSQPIVPDGTGTDGYWSTVTFHFQGDRREDYSYNADGTLAATTKADEFMDAGPRPDSYQQDYPEPIDVAPPIVGNPLATYTRDAMGRVTHYFEQGGFDGSYERTNIQYDAAGRELSETNITMRRDTTGGTMQTYTTYLSNSYSNGLLTGEYQNNWKGSSDTAAADSRLSYGYQWWDGAQQQTIGNDNDANGTTDWTTTYSYDPSGRAGSVYIADGKPRGVSLATDQNGMIIDRTEAAQGGSPRTLRYVFGGVQMGEVGNDGTSNTSFAASVADRLAVQPTPTAAGPFHNGATSGTPFADFDESYNAINSGSDAGAGSNYVAAAGDTLQSIAAMVWGDASLWYLLADANAMSGGEQLQAGRSITIPDVVANAHNNAATFRPYNAAGAVGDVSPTTPKPVSNHHGCGVVGTIILAAIAIAVTAIVTAGIGAVAAGTTFGEAWGAMMGGTLASLGATTTAAGLSVGGLGAVGAMGVAAAGAAVGSVVSQGIGVATGLQDQFSWKAVGLSALSAGIAQGAGSANLFGGKILGSPFVGNVVRGAAVNAVAQGVGIATGLQNRFDWGAVAAAGIGAGVGQAVGGIKGMNAIGKFGQRLIRGMAGDLADAAARTLVNGTDFGDNVLAALPDVIASEITGAISDEISAQNAARLRTAAMESFGQIASSAEGRVVLASIGGPSGEVSTKDLLDYLQPSLLSGRATAADLAQTRQKIIGLVDHWGQVTALNGGDQTAVNLAKNDALRLIYAALFVEMPRFQWTSVGLIVGGETVRGQLERIGSAIFQARAAERGTEGSILPVPLVAGPSADLLQYVQNKIVSAQVDVVSDIGAMALTYRAAGGNAAAAMQVAGIAETAMARNGFRLQAMSDDAWAHGRKSQAMQSGAYAAIALGIHEQTRLQETLWNDLRVQGLARVMSTSSLFGITADIEVRALNKVITAPDHSLPLSTPWLDPTRAILPGPWNLSYRIEVATNAFSKMYEWVYAPYANGQTGPMTQMQDYAKEHHYYGGVRNIPVRRGYGGT